MFQDAEQCEACPPGRHAVDGVECVQCPAGTFSNSSSNSACTNCSAGTSASSIGALSCTWALIYTSSGPLDLESLNLSGILQRLRDWERGGKSLKIGGRWTFRSVRGPWSWPLYVGKMGSICHFSRALPASLWGHSQVLVFASTWGTQKGAWQWHFSCCFSQHLSILEPRNAAKQGNAKMTNRPLFTPPPHSWPLFSRARPVHFGALPAAAKQLFTKPRSRPKIELNFEALSWFFLKEKPQSSYEPGGLVNSLVSGTPKI